MNTTNVKPSQLNYDKYSMSKYDSDIVNSIPFHKEIHNMINEFILRNFNKNKRYSILDLGVGTGITSELVKSLLPDSELDVVDFSRKMLSGARKRLGNKNVNYIFGDYSKYKFNKNYDVIISVIGLHHQTHEGKKIMFKKIYSLLKDNGVFILGDLITYKDEYKSALNDSLHYHYLVEHATDRETLMEWAYHHKYLNNPSPIEEQTKQLGNVGFKVKVDFLKFNTALLICKK